MESTDESNRVDAQLPHLSDSVESSELVEEDDVGQFIPPPLPVAPARIINSDRTPSQGSYPVASFVRDWVNTGLHPSTSGSGRNNLHHQPTFSPSSTPLTRTRPSSNLSTSSPPQVHYSHGPPPSFTRTTAATTTTAGIHHHTEDDVTRPLSVRTEPDLPSGLLRHEALTAASVSHSAPQIMDRGEALDDTTEYIIIDGDLIAQIPPPPNQAEQDFLEERLRQQLYNDTYGSRGNNNQLDSRRACEPKRVRKGMRFFTKLIFKRGGKNKDKKTDDLASMAQGLSTDSSVTISNSNAGSGPAILQRDAYGPTSMREYDFSGQSGNLSVDTRRSLSPVRQHASANTTTATTTTFHGISAGDLPSNAGLASHAAAAVVLRLNDEVGDGKPAAKTSAKQQQCQLQKSPPRKFHPNQAQLKDKHNRKKGWGVRGRRLKPSSSFGHTDDDYIPAEGVETQLLTHISGLAPPSTNDSSRLQSYVHQEADQWSQNNFRSQNSTPASASIPPMHLLEQNSSSGSSRQSVMASYVGTADLLQQGPLSTDFIADIAESFVEEDLFRDDMVMKKDDDGDGAILPQSLVEDHTEYKVDKADAPDVESMLRRALLETTSDLERDSSECLPTHLPLPPDLFDLSRSAPSGLSKHNQQADGVSSVPLSEATTRHASVYNDTLKVVMVSASTVEKSWLARRLRNCTNQNKRTRKRTTFAVDVHEWRPSFTESDSSLPERSRIKCSIWDVQGTTGKSQPEDQSNFGAHPGTQSLFFSAQSLYILVWDLACNSPMTNRMEVASKSLGRDFEGDDNESDFDDEDENDEFAREEANRQADRALQADITNRVLSWLDCIAHKGPRSAVLPVALVPEHMSAAEVKRRCDTFLNLLKDHVHRYDLTDTPPKLLTGVSENLLCVEDFGDAKGIAQLQEMVFAIANDPSHSVFDHVGTLVSPGTVMVYETIQRFKQDHKLILLDHVLGELNDFLGIDAIVNALCFMASIGEIIYFSDNDGVLSQYIILSRKWLISALSCILRNDLKRELVETRRFMNMQCIYTDEKFEENDIINVLSSGMTSSCPLLSDRDAQMLWQSMSFMREASDRYANLVELSTSTPTMFYFLERLLVHSGVFLPLQVRKPDKSFEQSEVFFVPSLLPAAQADPYLWSYMTSESWKTTLCHSWLFRDGAPSNLMENLTVRILRDLYEFSRSFQAEKQSVTLEKEFAVSDRATEYAQEHNNEALGNVRIHYAVCFRSSMLLKIGTVFVDSKAAVLRESFVEVFVTVVDQSSSHSVASDVMRQYMQRVVVSGKGESGRHGLKLWKGGYKCIVDSVRAILSNVPNVDSQVICPECLATSSPHFASTWGWDSVWAVANSGHPTVICLRGHRVNSNLICGTCPDRKAAPSVDTYSIIREVISIQELLPSVVLVAVWDPVSNSVLNVGSGFIIDKKVGLVVTAGHVLFQMSDSEKSDFGKPYFDRTMGRAIIGVIPDAEEDGKHAVFRYFADIVAQDIFNVDSCVLRITSRLETDIDDAVGVSAIAAQAERFISTSQMPGQALSSLKMTTKFQLDEKVRITGYNQGGEGIFEQGRHISRSVDVVRGSICRHFKASITDIPDDSSATSDSSVSQHAFVPKNEIVVMCKTISGHSGGPCVNSEGKVVGILSRSDPAEPEKCYLVPSSEIKPLVIRAKQMCIHADKVMPKTQSM